MDRQSRTDGDPVTKTPGTACILLSAVLIAFALLLSAAPPGAAAPPVAPKTLDLGKSPTIVFVHDLGGNRSVWMPTVRKLIGRNRVVIETGLKSPLKVDDQEIKGFLSLLDSNYDQILKMIFRQAGKDSMQGVAIRATGPRLRRPSSWGTGA